MSQRRKSVLSYLIHSQSGRARTVWTDKLGIRRQTLLPGAFDSSESRTAFARLQLEIEVSPSAAIPARGSVSMAEMLLGFLEFARTHYVRPDGSTTHEVDEYKLTVRCVREFFAPRIDDDLFSPARGGSRTTRRRNHREVVGSVKIRPPQGDESVAEIAPLAPEPTPPYLCDSLRVSLPTMKVLQRTPNDAATRCLRNSQNSARRSNGTPRIRAGTYRESSTRPASMTWGHGRAAWKCCTAY